MALAFWFGVFWRGTKVEKLYSNRTQTEVLIFLLANTVVTLVRMYFCYAKRDDNDMKTS